MIILVAVSCSGESKQVHAIDETLQGVKYLKVYGNFCTVEIEGTESSDLSIAGEIRGTSSPGSYAILYHLELDSTVKVWIDKPVAKVGNVQGKLSFKVNKNVEIKVVNETGDVYVEGMSGEKVRIKTSAGDVVTDDISTYLRVKTLEGDINVSNQLGNLKTRTTTGDQQLLNIEGDVLSSSTSGDMGFTNVAGGVHATTTSGDISGRQVGLKKDSHFNSNSGTIKVRLSNPMDELSFDLQTKTGTLEVGDSLGSKSFVTNRGAVHVMGETDGGNQSFQTK